VETRRRTYQGLWTDPVTGLSYARARWYDARNASWLSEDPLLDVDSPNLYAYVGWQPHMYTDPMGDCGPACLQVAGWLWGHRQDVAGTAASVAGAVVGAGVAAGELVAAPVTMAATESANTYYGAARVLDAYQAGGLAQAYQEAQRVGRETSAENNQRLVGMIPGLNTYRQASRIADVYETQGPFAGGMQVGRTTFSLGLDATVVYGVTSATRTAVRPSTTATSTPKVNLVNPRPSSPPPVLEFGADDLVYGVYQASLEVDGRALTVNPTRLLQERAGGRLLTDVPNPGALPVRQFSAQTMEATARQGGTVRFDLTHIRDVQGVLAGTSFPDAVTSFELRYIQANWPRLQGSVRFYRSGREVAPPW
jgi:RHS repeat-associated protein